MFVKSLGSILQVDESGKTVLDENGQPLLEPSGGFLQVSGARVYYDTTLPAEKRILSIDIWILKLVSINHSTQTELTTL